MNLKNNIIHKVLRRIYFTVDKLIPKTSLSEKEYARENKLDRENGTFLNPISELAITEFRKQGGVFNDFSLAESSVRVFLFHLLKTKQNQYHICEFGGGQSTIFWNILSNHTKLKVTTYEHDPDWAKYLQEKIQNKNISIKHCELMQIDAQDREDLFLNPNDSSEIWKKSKHNIPPQQYKDPVLKGAFYNVETEQFPNSKIDAIILDGPHGNGRSMCFPLFFSHIEKGTIILLDDYHHYPFLDDLSRLFNYEILHQRRYKSSNKGWVVLTIGDKRLNSSIINDNE